MNTVSTMTDTSLGKKLVAEYLQSFKKGDEVWVKGTVHTLFKNGVVRVAFENSDPTSPSVNPDHKWHGYARGGKLKFAAVKRDLIWWRPKK